MQDAFAIDAGGQLLENALKLLPGERW